MNRKRQLEERLKKTLDNLEDAVKGQRMSIGAALARASIASFDFAIEVDKLPEDER